MVMKTTWSQIRAMSKKYDSAELEFFRHKRKAKKNRRRVKTLAAACVELRLIHQSIRGSLQRRRRLRFIRRHLSWQPRKGLQLLAQVVAYCVRATTIEKHLEKCKLKRNLRASKLFADSATEARESMTQMLERYDEEIAFKLMRISDISTLRKVRDMFPHKVLVFSVGASVTPPALEDITTAAELLGLVGLRTSALFELRDGGFRMLEEAEARAKCLGFVYPGIYGHI